MTRTQLEALATKYREIIARNRGGQMDEFAKTLLRETEATLALV